MLNMIVPKRKKKKKNVELVLPGIHEEIHLFNWKQKFQETDVIC